MVQFDDYIKNDKAKFYSNETTNKSNMELLWGDRLKILQKGTKRTKVKARGKTGYVKNTDLGGEALLELYFIDVGQGDGVLIVTPDFKHIFLDGGFARKYQDHGKNASDFVDWKFTKEYGETTITIDAMIASHCDGDHYGGLWDLLKNDDEILAKKIKLKAFYHAGVSWWKKGTDGKTLGKKATRRVDNKKVKFLTQILEDKNSVLTALNPNVQGDKLYGEWAKFLKLVTENTNIIERLGRDNGYVPSFEPKVGKPALKILAPVEHKINGKTLLRNLGGNSINTNGNSLLLRLDFGNARILLTGDLNTQSADYLMEEYTDNPGEFMCDVAKSCHHGSGHISYEFLEATQPMAVIISSGDNEGHFHPRPSVLGASGKTGRRVTNKKGEPTAPLVYCTELARNVSLRKLTKALLGLKSKPIKKDVGKALNQGGLVYGLINVRTDGKKILCAARNEKDYKWECESFNARF